MPEKENVYNLRNRSVKRMLWPVDHEQTKVDIKREKQKIQKEMTEKYNFDFSTGKPLQGKYTWVSVGSESPISSPCLMDNERCSSIGSRTCLNSSSESKKLRTRKRTKENKNSKSNKRPRTVKHEKCNNSRPLKSRYGLRADRRHSSKYISWLIIPLNKRDQVKIFFAIFDWLVSYIIFVSNYLVLSSVYKQFSVYMVKTLYVER